MPSTYELSEDECAAIGHALMYWVKVRSPEESVLTDWQVLQLVATLGREDDVKVH